MPIASGSPSVGNLVVAVALVLLVFWVLPVYVTPRLAAWERRRRGGAPPGPWTAVLCAVCLTAFLVLRAQDGRIGRGAVAALLIGVAGVALGLWVKRRRG